MTETVTPMMAQWHECKAQAKDAFLLFRLGDFYEAFYEDAEVLSKKLSLTLTARQNIPMCGIPAHTVDSYIDKLMVQGFKVAIAEQVGDVDSTKGLVKREIVRIVTPGTLTQSDLLVDGKNNFFASISLLEDAWGLSFLDLSTGEFYALELDSFQELVGEITRLQPTEFLLPPKVAKDLSLNFPFLVNEKTPLSKAMALEVLACHFQGERDKLIEIKKKPASLSAAGSLLLYLKEERNLSCEHILAVHMTTSSQYVSIDRASLRNLELTSGDSPFTLLSILDRTSTPMGARMLHHWVQHPLYSLAMIEERQSHVTQFVAQHRRCKEMRQILRKVRDLERLCMRFAMNSATPRDLLALGVSLTYLLECVDVLKQICPWPSLDPLTSLAPLAQKICGALSESPPIRIGEGNIFRDGFHQELDTLRSLAKESVNHLARYQNTLREETGIKTLKVGFTRAFGYYIEVSRGQSDKIPPSFQRRQTLVNGERFTTEELKAFEHKVLSSEDQMKALEKELFENLRKDVALQTVVLHALAKEVGRLDCLLSLAIVAEEKGWTLPLVDESDRLEIRKGRHPIVEHVIGSNAFIANDTSLSALQQMMLITGPNMAGKSTYIRQVALLVLLAQIGSYVPAESAHIGLVDKIFSRIGASDDLSRGQSTFMVEMTETAYILKNATSRSLVLLDEIGRGTSTYDGIAIAWAVAEYLLTTPKRQAKTLFATHYWELTKLADTFATAANFQTAIQETDSGIAFLRKIIPGGTNKSYGIHVAKLAGLPDKVIQKAEIVLKSFEPSIRSQQKVHADQLSLFH